MIFIPTWLFWVMMIVMFSEAFWLVKLLNKLGKGQYDRGKN